MRLAGRPESLAGGPRARGPTGPRRGGGLTVSGRAGDCELQPTASVERGLRCAVAATGRPRGWPRTRSATTRPSVPSTTSSITTPLSFCFMLLSPCVPCAFDPFISPFFRRAQHVLQCFLPVQTRSWHGRISCATCRRTGTRQQRKAAVNWQHFKASPTGGLLGLRNWRGRTCTSLLLLISSAWIRKLLGFAYGPQIQGLAIG